MTSRMSDSRHAAALFRAAMAGFRTAPAVLVIVSFAFATADFTHFSARAADVVGKVRAAAHEGGRRPAEGGTVLVKPDAVDQSGEVAFAQTSLRAMFAFLRAL